MASSDGLPPLPPPTGAPMGNAPVAPSATNWPTGGLSDVLLGIAWVIFVGTAATAIVALAFNNSDSPAAFALGIVAFQLALVAWPVIVSKFKGQGLLPDWGLRFDLPRDIGLGFGLAIGCYFVSAVTVWLLSVAIALPDTGDPSNDSIITDNESSAWIVLIIFLVVIGAPFAEELLYRGLIMRSLGRVAGVIFGVVGSSFLFTIGHWQPDHTWRENVILLAALFGVGAVLAWGAIKWDRLGPPMFGHFFFNGLNTLVILAA